ncbi:MAG: molecular chaperone [Oscillospiraceae bacterium]|nr:molecular chaperone [Oscillospiraceae bacterium]
MILTKIEQETILNFNEGEDIASLYTHNKKLQERFDKLAAEYPEAIHRKDNGHGAITYEFSKKPLIVSFKAPLSEIQRQQYSERGKRNGIRSKRRA